MALQRLRPAPNQSFLATVTAVFCGGTKGIAQTVTTVISAGIAVAGTIGVIWAGTLWLTARDNEAQVAKAKRRFLETVIGIVALTIFDVGLAMFLPGGAASGGPTVVSSTSKRSTDPCPQVATVENIPDTPTTPSSDPSTLSTPSTPSDPSTPSNPSTPSTPSTPSGNTCKDYGVSSGTEYHTQFGSYADIQWKGGNCPNCKIRQSGCPMIAILNSIIKVTNCKLTPRMFADEMKSYTGNFSNRRGIFSSDSDWSNLGGNIINHYASVYKVNVKSIGKGSVKSAIAAGHAVIARGARGGDDSNKVFSKNGHFVAFVAINGNTVSVKNPASSSFSSVSFETATRYATDYWEVWK